jgi:hypothetical protein
MWIVGFIVVMSMIVMCVGGRFIYEHFRFQIAYKLYRTRLGLLLHQRQLKRCRNQPKHSKRSVFKGRDVEVSSSLICCIPFFKVLLARVCAKAFQEKSDGNLLFS